MEDASAVDLDWFWRGWFYTNDFVDISLNNVNTFEQKGSSQVMSTQEAYSPENQYIADIRNEKEVAKTLTELKPELIDSYTEKRNSKDDEKPEEVKMPKNLTDEERVFFEKGFFVYELEFENLGGLIMPVIVEFTFADGSKEIKKLPAEIWKLDNKKVFKTFGFQKQVVSFVLDPHFETADTKTENNYFPRRKAQNRLELYKSK
jgi:hypothetical protein